MCGICGKIDFHGDGISEGLLRRMCESISYRGPDDEGLLLSPPVALGHRRLSIIDLSPAGHQPMTNEDGDIWLVFNGEIYDFASIRQKLRAKGHAFRSHTDSEVIIHLYEEEGTACSRYLNGMFAFALWDGTRERLWLARDRLGKKPLVYYWDGRRFLFASEMKAILCDPDVTRDLDMEALELYLTLNYIPAPWTIFQKIRKVQPATSLVVEKKGLSFETFWDIRSGEGVPSGCDSDAFSSMDEAKGRLRSMLEDSVKRRLIADVPLGAFLSGGVDSSIVVALMARNSAQAVKSFSIGYKDLPSFDETDYAREAARFNRTEHHEFKLGYRDILETFPVVLENLDEPFADSSAVPTYIVSRETKRHVTVALSGDGGDELFAGYRMYLGEYWSGFYSKIPGSMRDHMIAPLVHSLPDARDNPWLEKIRRVKKFLRGMSLSFPERFCAWREVFPFDLRQRLLREPFPKSLYLGLVHERFQEEKERFPGDPVNLMLSMDVKGLLPGDMLTKVDRMSMANSLEVRSPFLDHGFVEFVFRLRGETKLGPWGGKKILLEAFKDLLPPAIRSRPKRGFEMPIGVWLRRELKFLIEEYLSEASIRRQGLFHHEVIRELINDHMAGRRDTSWHLWNLIVFQHWYRRYVS